ncbi:glutathione S-transferase theta-1-like [Hyperolius riggenbachi]|uniref:glutathione S-transferase theta-1-like n=1 Tax=Hyperolius riggenbachi TaxID=752182 RepID=UPI0035A2DE3E
MPDLTLYVDLLSQPCRSVYIFAKANNIPFNNHEMSLFKGDHMTEEFLKINPLHKVPTLKDGNFTMIESTAMLLYMANKFKTPDHWYPSDLQKHARVDEYLAWQHTNTRPQGSKLFWIKAMTPVLLGHEAKPETLDPKLAEFNTTLTTLEEYFIKGKPFIAGEEISIADLVAIVEIMQPVAAGIEVFESRPKLLEWKQRVVDAIGPQLFQEAHEKLLNMKTNMQNVQIPAERKEQLKGVLQFLSQ